MGAAVSGETCPVCGAALPESGACRDLFDQMLFWENEVPENRVVHHLLVLCYHIQHPHLYSPEGLAEGMQLLAGFVEEGWMTETVRRKNRDRLDSGARAFRIRGKPGAQGGFEAPVQWKMTAADVVAGGRAAYIVNVNMWAAETLTALRGSGNLETA